MIGYQKLRHTLSEVRSILSMEERRLKNKENCALQTVHLDHSSSPTTLTTHGSGQPSNRNNNSHNYRGDRSDSHGNQGVRNYRCGDRGGDRYSQPNFVMTSWGWALIAYDSVSTGSRIDGSFHMYPQSHDLLPTPQHSVHQFHHGSNSL